MIIGNKDTSLLSDINVTPFVDVMLVLLIIFMVTAPMMVQGVGVDLPETGQASRLEADEIPLVITVDAGGSVRINDYSVEIDFLSEKLEKILENRKSREVLLKADKKVPYGIVVRVMGEIKAAGVKHLGVVTRSVDEGLRKRN